MQYRTLGRTGLKVSVVGIGTAQFRVISEKKAIETLIRGLDLGINFVHVAPDYEGSEYIVSKALSETSHSVIVCGQAYDRQFHANQAVSHFEFLFERLCRTLDNPHLEIFGIACIDDRERFGENVWGRNGMVDFLLQKKSEGRLSNIFCSTHGSSGYIQGLIQKDIFDAVMIPYNLMSFHLLSSSPLNGNNHENLELNEREVLPLATQNNIGVMIMKPLGGGMMCQRGSGNCSIPGAEQMPTAFDILRMTVSNPDIHIAIAGVKSDEEVEEIASAGYVQHRPGEGERQAIRSEIGRLKTVLCSRCGKCDSRCSRHLPISWMIRAAYVAIFGDSKYETWNDVEYFNLYPYFCHPCRECTERTCDCPSGINVPDLLMALHDKMIALADAGKVQQVSSMRPAPCGDAAFGARVIYRDIPDNVPAGSCFLCRLYLENTGERGWFKNENPYQGQVKLGVYMNDRRIGHIPLREDTHPGERIHFSFDICSPNRGDRFKLGFKLLGEHYSFSGEKGLLLFENEISVKKPS